MSAPDDVPGQRPGEIRIEAAQLRAGVHVRLPVGWLEHPFTFNSFVIANEEQARQLAALKLPVLYCEPARCSVPPMPLVAPAPPPTPEELAEQRRLAELAAQQVAEKIERGKVMTALRERLDKAQHHYVSAAKAVGEAIKGFDSNPAEAVRHVTRVSEDSTAVLMSDTDSVIALIAEKGQSDGHTAHALSVMTLALLLGKQARLPERALRELGIAALLHDIGKAALSPSIVRKMDRNKHEEAVYRTHCRLGHASAVRAGGLSNAVLTGILHHHERLDGEGFPDHLRGDAIPVAARVVAIADRFDGLANPIDHRRALSPSEALATMWSKEQKGFDPLLLQLFVRAMGVYPPGSVVQLADGRVGAVVASAGTAKPLAPQVLIYEPQVPRRHAIIVDLANEPALKIERALRLQERSEDELDYLLPRRRMSWFHAEATG